MEIYLLFVEFITFTKDKHGKGVKAEQIKPRMCKDSRIFFQCFSFKLV